MIRRKTAIWRADVSDIPAEDLRCALFALRLLQGAPGIKSRLSDPDFVKPLAQLLMPLMRPSARSRLLSLSTADDDSSHDWEESVELCSARQLQRELASVFARAPKALTARVVRASKPGPVLPTVQLLKNALCLDLPALKVLNFLGLYLSSPPLKRLVQEAGVVPCRINVSRMSAMLKLDEITLRHTLTRQAPLQSLDLVSSDIREGSLDDLIVPTELLETLFHMAPQSAEELLTLLVEPTPTASWTLDAFPHLADRAGYFRDAFAESARQQVSGVNALLYGEPGTGKTEFARALANASGLSAFQVRCSDSDGDGLSRRGRLGAFLLAQRLLERRGDALLIFDEVEDVFEQDEPMLPFLQRPTRNRQKGWTNRILESNSIPTIWITNSASGIDPAFQRRFLLPLHFATPPRSVRRQMAECHLGGTAIPATLLDELAQDPKLSPAQLGAARRLIDLCPDRDPVEVVRKGLSACRQLIHGTPAPRKRLSATPFDPAYLNIGGDLLPRNILRALEAGGRASLCFYGPPGTGKTAFAELIADALDRELLVKRASDVLSCYVGETEQNLARAFSDADPKNTILLLDEVDSFLMDRREATRSWERSQVNELLQQMESYDGIFIAATNLMRNIDSAALRRFDFKLAFQALRPEQRVALFAREVYGAPDATVPPLIKKHLDRLDGLTAGDYATAARQQQLLGGAFDPERFLRALAGEWRAKREDRGMAA